MIAFYLVCLYVWIFFVYLSVCMSVPRFIYFGQLLRCADKRIVNIMKVYIERNSMQVELIRSHKKYRLHSRLLLRSLEFNGISPTFASCDRQSDMVFEHGKSFQHISVAVHTVRMESHYNNCLFDKRQFDSNLLLFTSFLKI